MSLTEQQRMQISAIHKCAVEITGLNYGVMSMAIIAICEDIVQEADEDDKQAAPELVGG